MIDKDVILESLYDSRGVGEHVWRSKLSGASDDIMFALAADAVRAVLDNWWHHDSAPGRLLVGGLQRWSEIWLASRR